MPWGTSDHRVLQLHKQVKGVLPEALQIRKRVFKNFSRNTFLEDVKKRKWWGSVYSEENLEKAAKACEKEFQKVLEKNCPVKSVELKKNYTPWLTQELKILSDRLAKDRSELDRGWNKEKQKDLDLEAKKLKQKLKKAEDEWRMRESKKMEKVSQDLGEYKEMVRMEVNQSTRATA